MRRLMHEVGFQRIDTYGDFQATHRDDEPDFFIHVAEKSYREEDDRRRGRTPQPCTPPATTTTPRTPTTSTRTVWGGEDIHVGLYERRDAGHRRGQPPHRRAHGGSAGPRPGHRGARPRRGLRRCRPPARRHLRLPRHCLNLSEVENERNRELTKEQDLDALVDVVNGSFEDLPVRRTTRFDVVWSQDALLHCGDRARVLEEIAAGAAAGRPARLHRPDGGRRRRPGGDRADPGALQLDTMGIAGLLQAGSSTGAASGSVKFEDLTPQLPTHYGRVLRRDRVAREPELAGQISEEYLAKHEGGPAALGRRRPGGQPGLGNLLRPELSRGSATRPGVVTGRRGVRARGARPPRVGVRLRDQRAATRRPDRPRQA